MSDLKGKTCQFAQPWEPGCGKPAKTEHEGKFYCGIHNPVKQAAKLKARNERWKVESEDSRLKQAKHDTADEMLRVLTLVSGFRLRLPATIAARIQRVIAKAEGKL